MLFSNSLSTPGSAHTLKVKPSKPGQVVTEEIGTQTEMQYTLSQDHIKILHHLISSRAPQTSNGFPKKVVLC